MNHADLIESSCASMAISPNVLCSDELRGYVLVWKRRRDRVRRSAPSLVQSITRRSRAASRASPDVSGSDINSSPRAGGERGLLRSPLNRRVRELI